MHQPVLLQEVIKFLDPRSGDFMIDGTVDGGGHAAEILKLIMPEGKFLGVDWDEKILAKCAESLGVRKNVILAAGNYADLPEILKDKNLPKADGLLLDLGFSSEQLESSGRGFSFLKDELLLMTYSDKQKPVKEILKDLSEKELGRIIFELSGEKFARRIAGAIKQAQKRDFIETAGKLAEIIRSAVPKNYERGRIDPATRTFQALRIYANDELGNLRKAMDNLPLILKKGGRVVIISFHSLEDKIVKNCFNEMKKKEILKIIVKKPVRSSREEIIANRRSRSARLRVAIMI